MKPTRRRCPQRLARLLLLLLGVQISVPALAAAERYEGLAYARPGGALVYKETHWRYQEGGVWQHLVLYGCPLDDRPFARKRLREAPHAETPDFDFQDARDGYREGVRSRDDGARDVYAQEPGKASPVSRRMVVPAGSVIDAGFDNFVRARWNRLSTGGAATVPFLIPSRFDVMDFKIADARDAVVDGVPVRRLRMTLSAWFSFVVPPIELAYARDGRRLVEFQGLGTIRDAQGRHQDVRIVFPERARQAAVNEAEVAEALARPLAKDCGSKSGS